MYKKIGIVGGLSPESTVTYYQYIAQRCRELSGDHSYPEIIIYSVNFQRFINWMNQEREQKIVEDLTQTVARLEAAGADFAVIACNTLHFVFDQVQDDSSIPLLSIVDATAEAIREEGLNTVGLLGTQFTMEKKFYREGLASHGVESIIPERSSREYIDKIILEELSKGIIKQESRDKLFIIIEDLIGKGAKGIVLGCTEIPLLIKEHHIPARLFDTATIHAEKALQHAIK